MNKVSIPHKAWVLVGDGRKALVLRNEGDAAFPNLRTADVLKAEHNPSTAQAGSDKPGRTIDHLSGRRAGVEQTDWHEIAEHKFAQHIASVLEARRSAGDFNELVVVAPPKTLAELRHSFSDLLRKNVVAELDKDLTKHPVHEIERLLTGVPKK